MPIINIGYANVYELWLIFSWDEYLVLFRQRIVYQNIWFHWYKIRLFNIAAPTKWISQDEECNNIYFYIREKCTWINIFVRWHASTKECASMYLACMMHVYMFLISCNPYACTFWILISFLQFLCELLYRILLFTSHLTISLSHF